MILRNCPVCSHIRLEGAFTLCTTCRVVTWPGRRCRVGMLEACVLERLMLARGGFVSLYDLIDYTYGDREDGGPLSADKNMLQAVYRIRSRLIAKGAPFLIETVKRQGYRLIIEAGDLPLTFALHNGAHVGKARLSAGVIPIGRERGETLAPALFSGAA